MGDAAAGAEEAAVAGDREGRTLPVVAHQTMVRSPRPAVASVPTRSRSADAIVPVAGVAKDGVPVEAVVVGVPAMVVAEPASSPIAAAEVERCPPLLIRISSIRWALMLVAEGSTPTMTEWSLMRSA